MSSSKLLLCCFWNEAHLNSGVRLLLELYCVIVIECCLYYVGEIDNGIHMYQFS